jgi:hypothetical protein
LKNCEDINKNLVSSFEQQMQQAIKDQFAGRKVKVEEKNKPQPRYAPSKAYDTLIIAIQKVSETKGGQM